jgi:hypothetical protein
MIGTKVPGVFGKEGKFQDGMQIFESPELYASPSSSEGCPAVD